VTTIKEQIALENDMIGQGIARHQAARKKAEEAGRGSEISSSRSLMKNYIPELAEHLTEWLCLKGASGNAAKYRRLIAMVDPEKAMFFTLKIMFDHFIIDRPMVTTAADIGRCVEDEAKFSLFQNEHKEYYNEIQNDFKRKGTKDYRYRHRVLTYKANEKELEWASWSHHARIQIGTKLIDIVLSHTPIAKLATKKVGRKTRKLIMPTEEALRWIEEHEDFASMLNPMRMPCIIPPEDWTSYDQGGYYTARMRKRCKFVKASCDDHVAYLKQADLSMMMKAINAQQRTAWSINTKILEVAQEVWNKNLQIGMPRSEPYEIPPSPVDSDKAVADMTDQEFEELKLWRREAAEIHTMQRTRISKCFQTMRSLQLARDYSSYPALYFVYQLDFRGRSYAVSNGLSPQGADLSKGLLRFANPEPVTDRAVYWLRVAFANLMGEDKVSYDDRSEYTMGYKDAILEAADDPLSNRFWANADKPWQCLAVIFELAKAFRGELTETYLPVGLDGTCNGLQNFSAMLRDEVGGSATNLVPRDRPADIYTDVARVLYGKIKALSSEDDARRWIAFCKRYFDGTIPRKLVKKPVMTLPYGSTRQACTSSVFQFISETDPKFFGPNATFRAAQWLTPLLWDSIGEVVVASRKIMDWVQNAASKLAKKNKGLLWYTPLGFPVYQAKPKIERYRLETQLMGSIVRFRVGRFTDVLDSRKQRQGSSPNYVHSCDATHMHSTVLLSLGEGIKDFAMIHDDFGTHATNIDKLHKTIRRAFLWLHGRHNPLLNLKTDLEAFSGVELPALPRRGTLDLKEVTNSLYFFG